MATKKDRFSQLDGMFSGMAPVTQAEPEAPKEKTAAVKMTEKRKSDGKKPFSVWLDNGTAEDVKLYSAVMGMKMTDFVESAFREYMKNHAMTAADRAEYRRKIEEKIGKI